MTDTDNWNICKKCGKAYENWSDNGNRTSRCLNCASPESRKRHGAPPRKRNCALCGLEFDVPLNLGATTKYCLEHRGMDTATRKREFAIRDGKPHAGKRFARKVSVDNHVYVSVYSLGSMVGEKLIKTLANKNVRLIRSETSE